MKLFILTLIAVVKAGVIPEKCDVIKIGNNYFEKEVLKDGLNSPYQLNIDHVTNTLFFSITENNNDDSFKSAYLNLINNDFGTISGIKGGFATAIDRKNHIVYLGGTDGIHKYDFDSKSAKNVGGSDKNIWQMYYNDKLYYTDYPTEKSYYYENGESKKLEELKDTMALVMAVDNNKDIYFSNSSGLFVYKRENATILNLGDYVANCFTTNTHGKLHFSAADAIYSIDGLKVNEIVDLGSVFGFAFDAEDHIIYAESESIVRLKPSKKTCDNGVKEITNNDV